MDKERIEKTLEHYRAMAAAGEINAEMRELWSTAIEALEFYLKHVGEVDTSEDPKAQEALTHLTRSRRGKSISPEGYEKIMDALFKLHKLETAE